MSCERQRSAIGDVALGAAPSGRLEAHLRSCPACRAVLDDERRRLAGIDEELQDALAVEPSVYLLPRVRERLAREARPSRAWGVAWLAPLVAGAAVLALVLPSSRRHPPAPVPASRPLASPVAGAEPSSTAAESAVDRAASGTRVRSAAVRAAPAPSPGEPEVVVPPGRDAALRAFVEGVRGLALTPDATLAANPTNLGPSEARVDPPWSGPVEGVRETDDVNFAPPALEPAVWID